MRWRASCDPDARPSKRLLIDIKEAVIPAKLVGTGEPTEAAWRARSFLAAFADRMLEDMHELLRTVTTLEVDVLGLDGSRLSARGRLVGPVQVRVRDDHLRWGRAPFGLVLGGVRVADERRVVSASERAVSVEPDARIPVCAPTCIGRPTPSPASTASERRVLEGVAVVLLDKRLRLIGMQLGDDPPANAAHTNDLLVRVLHPDDRDLLLTCPCRPACRSFATTASRRGEPSTTQVWTSTTRSAVFGRFSRCGHHFPL